MILGFDASKFQTANLDFQSAFDGGARFCWLRACLGTAYRDTCFEAYLAKAQAAGLVALPYAVIYGDDDPAAMAQNIIATLADKNTPSVVGQPPVSRFKVVALDCETSDLVGKWSVVEAVLGYLVGAGLNCVLYSYSSFLNAHPIDADSPLAGLPLWLADYGRDDGAFDITKAPHAPAPFAKWTFWQYSDKAKIDADLKMDGDVFDGELNDLIMFAAGA